MPKLCAVELCPAFARAPGKFCAGHVTAKKLHSVHKGRTCEACGRVLHEGDYVTRDSTATHLVHAECPPKGIAKRRRGLAATPLLDEV